MQCPRCDAVVPPLAEYCRQCGTPTAGGLRERRPVERTDEELKRNRRNIFILGAAFLFGVVVGGNSAWFGGGFDFDHDDRQERPAVVAALPLFDAYRDDEDEAEDRYGDRFMVVTGEYVATVNDGGGHPDLRLRTSDPAAPLGADLIESSHDEAARLRPGQIVTVGCERVAETGDEHWLQDCSIETVAEGNAAPAPDTAPREGAAG